MTTMGLQWIVSAAGQGWLKGVGVHAKVEGRKQEPGWGETPGAAEHLSRSWTVLAPRWQGEGFRVQG